MNEVIFTEIDGLPEGETTETTIAEITSVNVVDPDPFFMGMKIGGVCIILSLGVAVIINLFKKI